MDIAHIKVAIVKAMRETSIGSRRPTASLIIPQKSCPAAKPPKNIESVAWTFAIEVFRDFYISINEDI